MGRNRYRVLRLEEIAFQASYKEILANLMLIPQHLLDKKRHYGTFSSLISTNQFLTSENVCTYVRNKLSKNLFGTFSDEIRQKLVERFNHPSIHFDNTIFPSIFLDVVLDDSFSELLANVICQDIHLIPTIAMKCPSISTLKLNFEWIGDSLMMQCLMMPLIQPLSSLCNLTSLYLLNLGRIHKQSLRYLGQAAPKLTNLAFSKMQLTTEDIINLILGENAKKLQPRDIDKYILLHHKMPQEWITPFCYSLESLQLETLDERDKLSSKISECSSFEPLVIAFILCHMLKLKCVTCPGTSVCSAVMKLYQIQMSKLDTHPEHVKVNNEMAGADDPATNLNVGEKQDLAKHLPTLPRSGFSGSLALTSLDNIDIEMLIENEEMLRAVGKVCPNLDQIFIFESRTRFSWKNQITAKRLKFSTSSDVHKRISNYLPKVRCVTMFKVSPEYRKMMIEALGADLLGLTLASCDAVDLMELIKCRRLESLKILMSSSFYRNWDDEPNHKLKNASSFLPVLKTLESDICLRHFSKILQEKATLVDMKVVCCHVGTEVSDWQPSRILKMWSRIQNLQIRRLEGLTMTTAEQIFPLLSKLKSLLLPASMLKSKEREATHSLKGKLESRKIAVKFKKIRNYPSCSLLTDDEDLEDFDSLDECSDDDVSNEDESNDDHETTDDESDDGDYYWGYGNDDYSSSDY